MTTGAILSKSGKRVLLLEQHDQAGGCCHSFIDKGYITLSEVYQYKLCALGYEFDVGIHYIGEMGTQTLNKTLLDQICDGQIEWAPLDENYDIVKIGFDPESNKSYSVLNGKDNWKNELHKQFPDEKKAIDEFFHLLSITSKSSTIHGAMKLVPLWLVKLALATGIMRLMTNLFRPEYTRPLLEVVRELTDNKDLQTMFMYCWGDYGCPPSKTTFIMQVGD